MREQTPRQIRLRLNRMERWYRQQDLVPPEFREYFEVAFEYAETARHAEVIAVALRQYMRATPPHAAINSCHHTEGAAAAGQGGVRL